MKSKVAIQLIALLCGAVFGFGGRVLQHSYATDTDGSNRSSASGSMPIPASTASVEEEKKIPTREEFVKASKGERQALLLDYLAVADLDDIKALHDPAWRELPGGIDLDLVYRRAVEVDPDGLVAWLENTELDQAWHGDLIRRACLAWVKIDPRAAMARGSGATPWIRGQLIRELVKGDRSLAIELLREYAPNVNSLRELEAQELEELAVSDAAGALQVALDAQAAGRGNEGLQKILNNWAASDPQTALKWLREQTGVLDSHELASGIIAVMAESDLEGALQQLDSLPENTARVKLEGQIAFAQAGTDFDAALERVIEEPDASRRNFLLARISENLAEEEPQRFLDLLLEHGISGDQQNVEIFQLDWEGHGHRVGDSEELSYPVRRAALKIAEEDPRRAIAYIGALTDRSSVQEVSSLWAAKAPQEAAAFAVELPKGELRNATRQSVFSTWMHDSPQEAAEFLLSSRLVETDPKLAGRVFSSWSQRDASAAAAWLDVRVSNEVKEKWKAVGWR